MSKNWPAFEKAAKGTSAGLYLEATVGGGIPIIRTILDSMQANNITRVMGIINGTTNYILTGMAAHGKSFDKALKDAQGKGYAEAEPSFDIDGWDALHKIVILSSIAFDQPVRADDVHIQGIRGITKQDIDIARSEMGCVVKHLAMARTRVSDDALEVQVVPALLPLDHPLARVDGVNNGVLVKGDAVGEVMFSGRGAGKMPTASAVISDLIFVARNVSVGVAGRVPAVAIVAKDQIQNRFFIRVTAVDQPGVLAGIARVLADHSISISSVAQNEKEKGSTVPVYISTYKASEGAMARAVAALEKLPAVKPGTLVMRLEVNEA
jgi:homoserine dehydrogenase